MQEQQVDTVNTTENKQKETIKTRSDKFTLAIKVMLISKQQFGLCVWVCVF